MNPVDDTIVAVSSPPGCSSRGLVRVSGTRTRGIAKQLVEARQSCSGGDAAAWVTWGQAPCRVRLGDRFHGVDLAALIACFSAPHSYTGQDLLEVQCPGNPVVLERLVGRSIALGARLAEPGEFTFRAYVSGRLDLTQAEGVAATIAATSDAELSAAAMLRHGVLGGWSREWVDELATVLSRLEAGIDFVDQEDVIPIGAGELAEAIGLLSARIDEMLSRSRSWSAVEAVPRVVLVGPASSGKSTLFNALLARERSVVSDSVGTTRDVLEESVTFTDKGGKRVELMLVDVAGLDRPVSVLDRDVQAAARSAIERADLLVELAPAGRKPAGVESGGPDKVRVLSMADLADQEWVRTAVLNSQWDCAVSARTGTGLSSLRGLILGGLGDRAVSVSGRVLALQPRHEAALREAVERVQGAKRILVGTRSGGRVADVELVSAELRGALDAMAGLGGEVTADDVIGRVFETFCIGK